MTLAEQLDAGTGTTRPPRRRARRKSTALSLTDRIVLLLMVGIPAVVHVALVWVPTIGSIVLSFSEWDGIGGLSDIKWIGTKNYVDVFTAYPRFWPAVAHNLIWLVFLIVIPTAFGLLMAVLLDRKMRFSSIYQSILYLPVVLSLALVGFIWQLMYEPDKGLVNNLIGQVGHINWLGDSSINLYAVLVAAAWRHTGYVMLLFLAGLKALDPALKEAASLDGANSWQTFWRVTFPVLKPINIIVLVVTVIEALRAYDIVFIINRGRNGLELLSILITDNIIGESSRIGYGSAIAVVLLVISLGFIITYLVQVFRKEERS
ncbi:MAG TPA: sugar ABC transporter permease [Kutzneria sp.]|nr:sugar ABC transporter permease [Kutzneria sp.]